MKLKFAQGHVMSKVDVKEMQELVKNGNFSQTIALGGGQLNITMVLGDADETAVMQFDPNASALHFLWPRNAVVSELAKPTKAGIGGYFEEGIFSLAIDMHDVRDRAKKS